MASVVATSCCRNDAPSQANFQPSHSSNISQPIFQKLKTDGHKQETILQPAC